MAGKLRRWTSRLTSGCNVSSLQEFSIEPMVFFFFISMNIYHLVQQVGIYRIVCEQTYYNQPAVDCSRLADTFVDGKRAETVVQQKTAMWNVAMGLAYMLPAAVADLFLGAWGDRWGRKDNVLVGMAGLMVAMFPLTVVFTYPQTPLYVLVLCNLVAGFTGFISLVMISVFAYLADTVVDRSTLTVRIAITSMVMNVTGIIGQFLAGALTHWMTNSQVVVVCQLMLAIGFFICLIRFHNLPPDEMRLLMHERARQRKAKKALEAGELPTSVDHVGGEQVLSEKPPQFESSPPPPSLPSPTTVQEKTGDDPQSKSPKKSGCCGELGATWRMMIRLLKETFQTYRRPREGNGRTYLLVSAVVFMLSMISELGLRATIFTLYVQRHPLGWDQEMIGYYRAANGALQMLGTGLGVVIFKKLIGFSDTFVVVIAMASSTIETLIMAFATSTWIVYLAALIGSLSSLSAPCMQSFTASLVRPDEVGKSYSAFGLAANLSFLISALIYNGIYQATVAQFPGFVFIFASAIHFIALGFLCWMHLDVHFKPLDKSIALARRVGMSFFGKGKTALTDKVTPVIDMKTAID